MKLKVNGKEAYYTSSGREIDKNQPSIVFVHGSGLSHVTWVLQTRYFAFHGYNTIALDLACFATFIAKIRSSISCLDG